MKRTPYLALVMLAGLSPLAQAQLKPSPPPTETRPVSQPQPPPLSTAPAAEPDKEAAPATPPRPANKPRPRPIAQPAPAPRPIYDSKGQPAPQMRQAGANRVMDTRTGKYYDTVPSGTGQQVVPPPSGAR